jgi:hypothetical protein
MYAKEEVAMDMRRAAYAANFIVEAMSRVR